MVMVLTAVMAVLGAGLLVSSNKYLANANAAKTSTGLSSCAQAVRQYLAAQAALGPIGNLSLTVAADGGTPITLVGGHYEAADAGNFRLPSTSTFGVRVTASTQNLTNALPMNVGTGTPTTNGTAVCTDSDGRTYEVEFSLVGG
jgi:type II secretory pathway pseudopilin PulG